MAWGCQDLIPVLVYLADDYFTVRVFINCRLSFILFIAYSGMVFFISTYEPAILTQLYVGCQHVTGSSGASSSQSSGMHHVILDRRERRRTEYDNRPFCRRRTAHSRPAIIVYVRDTGGGLYAPALHVDAAVVVYCCHRPPCVRWLLVRPSSCDVLPFLLGVAWRSFAVCSRRSLPVVVSPGHFFCHVHTGCAVRTSRSM